MTDPTPRREAVQCPGCGGITDDPAGGPCSLCWKRTDEAERLERERDVAPSTKGWRDGMASEACVFCIDAGADFDWCRACGRGTPHAEARAVAEPRSPLLEAIRKAVRGRNDGDAGTAMIARTYYDEPTTRGWLVGWRYLHIEVNPRYLRVQFGPCSLAVAAGDTYTPSEWEDQR
jgi:hypothetical protein